MLHEPDVDFTAFVTFYLTCTHLPKTHYHGHQVFDLLVTKDEPMALHG